jgi:F-type H+-transporting ATPase subunit delta
MAWNWRDMLGRLKGHKTPDAEGQASPVAGSPAEVNQTMSEQKTPHDQPEPGDATASRRRRRASAAGGGARVYAQALLEMADEKGALDETASEVEQLQELLASQPDLTALMSTPALGAAERRELIERVFKGRVSDTTYKFLQVVNDKGRLAALPGILASFEDLLDQRRGIVEVDAYVAQRLDPAEAEQVARRIGAALRKEVVLHQYVNPDLIGGLVLRVGDQLIDGSVATQLKLMRQRLIEAGRNRARTQNP